MSQYNENDIVQQRGAVRIRLRPASMLGDASLAGARHGFTEIYGNALDEASTGYGDTLEVTYYEDGAISVRDYGRGVPIGWNDKESNWNWHIIYNELFGGGKYDTHQAKLAAIIDWSKFDESQYNYLYSVGLNGLGAASTQYTSEFFSVKSYKNGVCTEMDFDSGLPIINGVPTNVHVGEHDMKDYAPVSYPTQEANGTLIKWKPDARVFDNVNVGGDWLFSICKDIAYVAKMNLVFENKQTGFKETIPAGTIVDLLCLNNTDNALLDSNEKPTIYDIKNFTHGLTNVEGKPFVWVCKANVVIEFIKDKPKLTCYHNSIKMQYGVQYDAVYAAFDKFFLDIAKQNGIKKLVRDDYESCFSVIVSSYSNCPTFKGQTKDTVSNDFIYKIVYDSITSYLARELGKGSKALTNTIESVVSAAQTRIAIQEYSAQIKEAKKLSKGKDPNKFSTCKAYMRKDYANAELWITEGDSASGAITKARNSDFQAVFPVRGKCLNVLKSSMDKILKNKEIKEIFSLLGTGMDLGHENMFDISQLKFNKIIFATDADEDGFQIRVLLFLIFYKLAPDIIRKGHIYVAETPRFEVKLKNGDSAYAKTNVELDKIVALNNGDVRGITRFKGLGEANPPMLRATTVHPSTRSLVSLQTSLMNETEHDIIDALFGMDKNLLRRSILTEVLGEDIVSSLGENGLQFNDDDDVVDEDLEDSAE